MKWQLICTMTRGAAEEAARSVRRCERDEACLIVMCRVGGMSGTEREGARMKQRAQRGRGVQGGEKTCMMTRMMTRMTTREAID